MGQDKAEALRGFLNIRDTPQGFLPLSVWQYGRIAEQADLYRRSGMLMVTHYATGLTPYAKTYGATAGKNRLRTLALSYVHPDKGTFETDVWDFDLMPDAASAALVLSAVFSGSGKDVLAEDAQNLLAWVWHLCGDNANTGCGVAETRLLDLRMLSRVAVYDLERRYRTAPGADKRPYLGGKLSDSKGFKENAADANDVTDYMMLLPEIEEPRLSERRLPRRRATDARRAPGDVGTQPPLPVLCFVAAVGRGAGARRIVLRRHRSQDTPRDR